MSLDCFRTAVESLVDWPGIVGLFGGNPCAHPQFESICSIFQELIPEQSRRGIWANDLRGHGETVRRVFWPRGRFNLNAHARPTAAAEVDRWLPGKLLKESRSQPSWHSPILLSWKDLKVSEEDWIVLRENCDVNQRWSAAVAERDGLPYAYFCEVAAALDGVRGENNGVLVSPGWWRQGMSFFDRQVELCCDRGCGVPFRLLGHLDREETYDVTASWLPVVCSAGRNRVKADLLTRDVLCCQGCSEATDYLRRRTPHDA